MRLPSAIVALCAASLLFGRFIGAADPGSPPTLLSEAEYAKRLAATMSSIDLAALDRSHPPITGVELVKIEPGSQAEKLGLAVGDRVIDVGGVSVDTIPGFKAARQLDRTQQATVWSLDAGRRVVTMQPGPFGISFIPAGPNVEAGYLASSDRSPAWDAAMTAAALASRLDPELALTALAHAYANGYRGIYLRALQANASAAMGMYADASAAAALDPDGVRSAPGLRGLQTMYGAALVDGRLADAKAVLVRFPELHQSTDGFAPYLAELAARQERHAAAIDPLADFATSPHFDLTGMMRVTRPGEDMTKAMRDVHDHTDTADCTVGPGYCFWFEIALPPVDTFACTLQFQADFVNGTYPEQNVNVSIGPPNDQQDLDDDFRLYGMDYTARVTFMHEAMVYLRGLPRGIVPVPHRKGLHNTYTLRIARKAGIVAWSLDGQRFGCQPVLGGSGVKSLYVFATSCHFIVRGLDVDCFDAKPPEGWKPVEKKRVTPVQEPAGGKGAGDF